MKKLSDFSYSYPPELVALYPADKRDESRLMVVDRSQKTIDHKKFKDILSFFKKGDVLIFNNTKVFPARLFATKSTGGKIECLLVRELQKNIWSCLLSKSSRINKNEILKITDEVSIKVLNEPDETREIEILSTKPLDEILNEVGHVPLPPYIPRPDEKKIDLDRYQTVYARHTGSVAAPTAGLHFTKEVLQKIKEEGVDIGYVTLHVGPGTFLPVRAENILEHKMHGEFYSIEPETAALINQAKKEGRRVFCVGTTSLRAVESAYENGKIKEGSGYTEIFIHEKKQFQVTDGLITNFHQPESTLLILVCAFASYELIMQAYRQALENQYRLFSYGDCMLIL